MEGLEEAVPFALRRLAEHRLAVFVGAGVSAEEADLPNGQELKCRLLDELGESDGNKEDLPTVASRFVEERDRNALFDVVKEALRFRGDLTGPDTCASYKLLARLPIKTILTTNFDDLIEDVFEQEKLDLTIYRQDRQLGNYKHDEMKLLKIHGDLSLAADELVLTSEDYATYRTHRPLFSNRIADIFQTHTVVFLGYGLGDPNFEHIYDEVLTQLTTLKMKCLAIQRSEPPIAMREYWRERKVEIIAVTARAFLSQLQKAHRQESQRNQMAGQPVKVYRGQKLDRPIFHRTKSPSAARKAFSYFVVRQKRLLITAEYGSCVVDTLLNTKELTDPTRKLGRDVRFMAKKWGQLLQEKGFNGKVLPLLDEIPARIKAHRIEEADFCVAIVSSLSYGTHLNSSYGPVAGRKPILLFVHRNLRSQVKNDMVFPGLVHMGADLKLFQGSEILSGQLWLTLEQMLEAKRDEWLVKAITGLPFARVAERKGLGHLLGFDSLLALSVMERHRRVNEHDLRQLLGTSPGGFTKLLENLESLHAIRRDKDSYEISPLGRKVASALQLYKFDFADPGASYAPLDSEWRKPRHLAINEIYVPKGISIEGV
jgi:SIR2-like domain